MLPAGYQPSADAAEDYLLFVKFADSAQVRTKLGTTYSQSGSDIDDALTVVAAADASFEQVLTGNTCPGLSTLQSAAEQRSGRPARDLAGIHRVVFSATKTAQEIADLGNNLTALSEVEFADMRFILPGPAGGTTPDFTGLQGFFASNPGGNFDYAHQLGLDGTGIRVTEISVTYDALHEDLDSANISMELNFPVILHNDISEFPPAYDEYITYWLEHGSATLGMLFSEWNAFGMNGLTTGADGFLYPIHDTGDTDFFAVRTEEALCNALVDSQSVGVGNVVYIEAETFSEGLPLEVDQPTIWEITRLGVDAGVIVLTAAGNGEDGVGHDLDSPIYQDWQDCGDSGAIFVGAGTSDANHDRLSFSNYGTRVHPHGWGESVATLGYGDLFDDPNDVHRRYTGIFSGTSSATPMVTAAAILVQEYTISQGHTPLDSEDMRSLLTHTGIPQGTGLSGHIGPFINVQAAVNNFDIYDLSIETVQLGSGPATTYISNNGPRIAANVDVEIIYDPGPSPMSLTPINVPGANICEPLEYPSQCSGGCPATLSCNFDEISPDEPAEITYKYCAGPNGGAGLTVNAETSSVGQLTDNNLSNNTHVESVVENSGCGILQ